MYTWLQICSDLKTQRTYRSSVFPCFCLFLLSFFPRESYSTSITRSCGFSLLQVAGRMVASSPQITYHPLRIPSRKFFLVTQTRSQQVRGKGWRGLYAQLGTVTMARECPDPQAWFSCLLLCLKGNKLSSQQLYGLDYKRGYRQKRGKGMLGKYDKCQ